MWFSFEIDCYSIEPWLFADYWSTFEAANDGRNAKIAINCMYFKVFAIPLLDYHTRMATNSRVWSGVR